MPKNLRLGILAGYPFTAGPKLIIKQFKLEYGTKYTIGRKIGNVIVPNDPIPNKSIELSKCQRYLIIGTKDVPLIGEHLGIEGTINSIFYPTPVTMRATPTFHGHSAEYSTQSNKLITNIVNVGIYLRKKRNYDTV